MTWAMWERRFIIEEEDWDGRWFATDNFNKSKHWSMNMWIRSIYLVDVPSNAGMWSMTISSLLNIARVGRVLEARLIELFIDRSSALVIVSAMIDEKPVSAVAMRVLAELETSLFSTTTSSEEWAGWEEASWVLDEQLVVEESSVVLLATNGVLRLSRDNRWHNKDRAT